MVELFNAVQIETTNYCNRQCYFCPNVYRETKEVGVMEEQTFFRIVEQLEQIKYKGRVSPYLNGECLTDGRICHFVKYLRIHFPNNIILINTNGDRLRNLDFFDELLSTEIDVILINCYDDQIQFEEMNALVHVKKQIHNNILIHPEYAKLMTMSNRNCKINIRIKKIFSAKSYFWNRGGNVPNIAPSKYSKDFMCKFPFTQLYINYLGDCILCCSDWNYEVKMGNINDTDIIDIWRSPLYNHYRNLLILGEKNRLPLCRNCNRFIS